MIDFLPVISFIANINFGENFLLCVTSCILILTLLLLLFSLVFKTLRLIDKTFLIGVIICAYSLCLVKTFCQMFVFNSTPFYQLIVCSFIAFFQSLTLFALCLLKAEKLPLSKDNELIGGFFSENTTDKTIDSSLSFAKNPFKKVERLPTSKMFENQESDYNLNYSYILKRIDSIDLKSISSLEKAEIFKLKNMIDGYAYKQLNDVERENLCDGIRKFLKISAKYDEFSPDKF